MTEIQEMAQAIHEKHKALWPLTWAVADFMAKQLAGDQGYLIVNQLTHELMGLNTEPVDQAPAQDEQSPEQMLSREQIENIARKVHGDCIRLPGATYQHAAEAAVMYTLERIARPAQTAPQPEQNGSLNMEPEGANAYLVVDPDDNYHICYVVRSKDQALQHASGGLLAFGPITQE